MNKPGLFRIIDKPVTFGRRHWDVSNEVMRLGCGRTWRKRDVVINACIKDGAAYVMITAPNKYWPAHGKYMYTYMEAPFNAHDMLIDELQRIGEELGISVKDVVSYIITGLFKSMRKMERHV